jgi:tetratricopeptide (TPR) repeat protein
VHALRDYNSSLTLEPESQFGHDYRGFVYLYLGDRQLAFADFDKAIAINQGASAYNYRCYAFAVVGETTKALTDCDKSLQLRPEDANTLDSRAYARLQADDLDGAIADYDAALRADPRQASSFFGRAIASSAKGTRSRRGGISTSRGRWIAQSTVAWLECICWRRQIS